MHFTSERKTYPDLRYPIYIINLLKMIYRKTLAHRMQL
jgi:hypothetical protein